MFARFSLLIIVIICLSFCSYASAVPSVPEIIKKQGYPVEVHHVTTSDGYILTMHRIPHGNTSDTISTKPVLVQHGLLFSSAAFVLSEDALGFALASAGYDVWLGNSRGNFESRNHTSLNPDKDPEFWHFSWNEMGIFDLPATIDYILTITGQANLYYIGHSQGTTSFFVMAATLPEYNSKIRAQVSLAPVAYLKNMPNLALRTLAKLMASEISWLEWFGINELFSNKGVFARTAVRIACPISDLICRLFFNIPFNFGLMNTPMERLTGYFPAGVSARQVAHYGQSIKSGDFRKYDFGKKENREKYQSNQPPAYNLKLITAPCYLFYSLGDEAVAPKDALRTCDEMGNCAGSFLVEDKNFNHVDYLIGLNASKLLYPHVIEVLNSH